MSSSAKGKFPSFWVTCMIPPALWSFPHPHLCHAVIPLQKSLWDCKKCSGKAPAVHVLHLEDLCSCFCKRGKAETLSLLYHCGGGPEAVQCALVVALPFPSDAGVHPQILLQLLLCQPQENVPIHLVILPRETQAGKIPGKAG